MSVRAARLSDAEAVFGFADALSLSGGIDRAAFDAQYAAALTDDRTTLLVAEEHGQGLVRYLLGVVCPMFVYNGGLGFVQELYVREEHRREGVGAELMRAFTDEAESRDAAVVGLVTSRAGSFYEALGYRTEGAAYYKKRVG